jgi:hypothetical protein
MIGDNSGGPKVVSINTEKVDMIISQMWHARKWITMLDDNTKIEKHVLGIRNGKTTSYSGSAKATHYYHYYI